mgnify:CR=1 FL=1
MKQIGGFFTYEPLPETENHYLENLCPPGGSLRFFMSGRCANYYALQDICLTDTRKAAYVPVYTCETVLAPFLKAGYELLFYDVSKDLTPIFDERSWTASASSISAAITAFAATTGNLYGNALNGASLLWRIRPTPSSHLTVLTLTVITWWAVCGNGLEYRPADLPLKGKAAFPFPSCPLTRLIFPCAVFP